MSEKLFVLLSKPIFVRGDLRMAFWCSDYEMGDQMAHFVIEDVDSRYPTVATPTSNVRSIAYEGAVSAE